MPAQESPRRSPYQGLIPYGEDDAPYFFGREKETRLITANLFASPLTILYGASGVGKSSVLRAGAVHHLAQRNDLLVVFFNMWQGAASSELKGKIAEAAALIDANLDAPSDSVPLADYLGAVAGQLNRRLMIILDQFEEYFLYHPQDDEFAAEFPGAVTQAEAPVSFLISIREDFYAKLDRFEGRIPTLYDNYLRIEHLSRKSARAAIEKPIEQYNLVHVADGSPISIEPELVEAVLKQVEAGRVVLGEGGRGTVEAAKSLADVEAQIETPFLQMVLTRLWDEEMHARSDILRLETLERLGGAESIVRTHLDAVISTLPEHEQEIAARIFHYLVTPSGTKIAYSASDLAASAKLDEAEVVRVLEELSHRDVRILRPVHSTLNRSPAPRYQIFHDVLAPAILIWRTSYMQEYERAKAERRAEEQQRTAKNQARMEEQAKVAGRMRRLAAALALVSLLAVVLAVVALFQRAKARDNEKLAAARELAGTASIHLNSDPELSVLLALEAVHKLSGQSLWEARGKEAWSALHEAIQASRVRLTLPFDNPQVEDSAGIGSVHFVSNLNHAVAINSQGLATVWDTVTGEKLRVIPSPIERVEHRALSPDGSLFVTAGPVPAELGSTGNLGSDARTNVLLWDTATGKSSSVPHDSRKGDILNLSFINDGKTLAIVGYVSHPENGTALITLQLWDVVARRPGETYDLNSKGPYTIVPKYVAFSFGAKRILISGVSEQVMVWDAPSRSILRVLKLKEAVLSPDGTIVAGLNNDELKVLKADSGQTLHTLFSPGAGVSDEGQRKHNNITDSAADVIGKYLPSPADNKEENKRNYFRNPTFSPDGKYLAASMPSEGTVGVWEVASGAEVLSVLGEVRESDAPPPFSFSADGNRFAAPGSNGTVKVWDLESHDEPLTVMGHKGLITSISFSPDGQRLNTGSNDGTARVWDISSSGDEVFTSGLDKVENIVYRPKGKHLAVTQAKAGVSVWDTETGTNVYSKTLSGFVFGIAYSPDGERLAISDIQGNVRLLDAASGDILSTFSATPQKAIWAVAFSPDGKRLAAACSDGTAHVLDAESGLELGVLIGHEGKVVSIAFSPDGRYIATGSKDKTAILWDARTYRELHRLTSHDDTVSRVAFSPDRKRLATSSPDHYVKIWDVESGQALLKLSGHSDKVLSVSFSPDGRHIATTSSDQTTKVWDARSGEELLTLRGHRAPVNLAAFSPDGARLATCSDDGTIRVYTLSSEELIALARKHISPNRELTTEERKKYLHE
ncbi:MAG TPA: PQQ-binding-like beta-propeller repeat protein [Pyrinomonadaceae bacterium]|jgi:WD40 repeat protein